MNELKLARLNEENYYTSQQVSVSMVTRSEATWRSYGGVVMMLQGGLSL